MQSESNNTSVLEAMTKRLEEQEEIISQLEVQLQSMVGDLHKSNAKLARTHDQVYRFLGGLFNQEKQKGTLNYSINMILGVTPAQDSLVEDDETYWGSCPTTRQGDENARRIDEIEQKLSQIGKLFPPSKVTEERIKSSFSLCGNE